MSNKTVSKLLTLTDSGIEIVLAEGSDVDVILAGSMRADSQYGELASHRTNSTRKYQCNASLAYETCVAKVKAKIGAERDGAAIRAIFEAGLVALGFESIVDEVNETETEAE